MGTRRRARPTRGNHSTVHVYETARGAPTHHGSREHARVTPQRAAMRAGIGNFVDGASALGDLCVRADDTLGTVERNGDANGAIERGRVHRIAVRISVGGERIGERAQAQGPHDARGRKVVRDGARRVGDELLRVQRSRAKRVPVALRRARRGGDSLPSRGGFRRPAQVSQSARRREKDEARRRRQETGQEILLQEGAVSNVVSQQIDSTRMRDATGRTRRTSLSRLRVATVQRPSADRPTATTEDTTHTTQKITGYSTYPLTMYIHIT